MTFICYPKCTTCRRARAYLDERGIAYTLRDIKEHNPTADELRSWLAASGLPPKKFFNTSGQLYRAMALSTRLPTMTDDEMLALLASDGMLVKRPILVTDTAVLVGFRAEQWDAAIAK